MSDLNAAEITKPFASIKISDPDASESTIDPKPPRANFPLPLELRELIYEHLLDPRYTKLKRRTRENPAYKFHTNILAVNRTIHEEAEQILDKRNIFVNAFHTLDKDDAEKLMETIRLWVPLVSWKYKVVKGEKHHLAKAMRHNSLQIHLAYNSMMAPGFNSRTDHSNPIETPCCVFLAADLEAYCSALSEHLAKIPGPKLSLNEVRSMPVEGRQLDSSVYVGSLLDSDGRPRFAPRLQLVLHSTKHKVITRQRQASLLVPFRTVIGPSLRVSIMGDVVDHAQLESVKKHMGPSLTCMRAEYWASFENLEKLLTIADSTALRDELVLAGSMYDYLILAVNDLTSWPFASPPRPPTGVRFQRACRLLEIDTLISMAHVCYRLRRRKAFNMTLQRTVDILKAYYKNLPGFYYDPAPFAYLTDLGKNLDAAEAGSDTLPLKCINLRSTNDITQKPEDIFGWVDASMLSQVRQNMREFINDIQTERGLPVTQCSEFDQAMRRRRS